MAELYGKYRAIGEQSKTALEMRQWWATSTEEGSMENIEDIDHLVAQNEDTLKSCSFVLVKVTSKLLKFVCFCLVVSRVENFWLLSF